MLKPATIALAMLSLSIGWGIRGNYGHEAGAMMPGMLCAVAIALFSARDDWRRRVPFFAVFGALGWAFGGSMSYMLTMSYTQSGHLPTQFYGFFTVFAMGFLWTSLGAAGTAYAAVESRERLTAIFKPLCWVLAVWTLQYFWEQYGYAGSDFRQRDPLYWLDSDWFEVSLAILALCLYDLWDRRGAHLSRLALFAAAGAAAGFALHHALIALGWLDPILSLLVHPQGDTAAFPPETLVTNWPRMFADLSAHMGWILGLIAGLAVYFRRYGQFRNGASLFLHIAIGGFAVFLAGPVLLSNLFKSVGGFRMVPPRGDNWAMVLGYFLGVLVYTRRNGLRAVADASVIGGILGGLGFMLAQFVKMLVWMPGNPLLTQNPAVIDAWKHWRSANWHSIVAEQGVGLLYGLSILIAMAMVDARTPVAESEPRVRRWTEFFSVAFILNLLVYVNLVKNVGDYTASKAVPPSMKMPLFGSIELSALGWFNLFFGLFAVCTIALLIVHARRPLAFIPADWLGRGQLFYLVFLWIVVIGNFHKALVAFRDARLATEGVIFINALVATFLILAFAPDRRCERPFRLPVRRVLAGGLAALLFFAAAFTAVEHSVYGGRRDGFGGNNLRFGPNADWRLRPIQTTGKHM